MCERRPIWIRAYLVNINEEHDVIELYNDIPAYEDDSDETIDELVNEALMNAPYDPETDDLLNDENYRLEWERSDA